MPVPRTRSILVLVMLLAAAGQVSRAQAPPQAPTSPPAGPQTSPPSADTVYTLNDQNRITPPRVIKDVRPTYTAEAVRNRIQGRVRLQGIVERDGTVSGVTVIQSLDTQFGVDQSAVDAFKQWRFQPGTTPDGMPVRVYVTIEFTLALANGPMVEGWPEGFRDTTPQPDAVAEEAETVGLRLRISRPAAWTRRVTPPVSWVQFSNADGTEFLTVLRPDGPGFDLSAIPAEAVTATLAGRMRADQASLQPGQGEVLASGQVQAAPGVVWVWSALRVGDALQVPGVPQNTPVGEVRSWVFIRAANGKAIVVQCALLLPRNLDSAALAPRIQAAPERFGEIIKSISVEPTN